MASVFSLESPILGCEQRTTDPLNGIPDRTTVIPL